MALALGTALALILAAGTARAQDSMAPLDPIGLFGAPTQDMSRDLPPAAPLPSDGGWGMEDPTWILPDGTDLFDDPAYGPSSDIPTTPFGDPAGEEAEGWDGWNGPAATTAPIDDPAYDPTPAMESPADPATASAQGARPFFSDDLAIEPTFGLGLGTEAMGTGSPDRGLEPYIAGGGDTAWDAGQGWADAPFATDALQEDTSALPGTVPGVSIDTGDGGIVRTVLPPLGTGAAAPHQKPTTEASSTAAQAAPGLPQDRAGASWSAHRVAEVLDSLAAGNGGGTGMGDGAATDAHDGHDGAATSADAMDMSPRLSAQAGPTFVADPSCDAWLRVDQPSTVSTALLLDAPCLADKDVYVVMGGARVERAQVGPSGGMQMILGHQGATHPFQLVDAGNGKTLLIQDAPNGAVGIGQDR